jgi:16S rRNA processing protein RimM
LKHNTYKLSLKGITTRTQADLLKGKALYIQTSQLQPLKEEDLFYRSQLIGNIIETEEGKILGPLMAIHHFGASDILEGGTFRLPFIKEATPVIDLEGKRIIVKDAFVIYDDACPSSPSERHKLSSQRIDLLLEEKKT